MTFVPITSLIDPDKIPSDGILFAWGIKQEGTGVEIAPDKVTDELLNSDQPVWLHLNFSNTRVLRWLERTKIVPAELADSVLNDTSELSTNAITELSQGALFHLKDFSLDFGQGLKSNNLDFESFWCYLTPTLLITGRLHPLKTLDQTKF